MPGSRRAGQLINSTSTLLPFLFQTRTIAARSSAVPFHKFLASRASRPRCLHYSRSSCSTQAEEDPWAPDPSQDDPTPPSPDSRPRDGRKQRQWVHDIPFEHLETPASRRANADRDLSDAGYGQPDMGTLTDPERQAFQRLFQSLGSRQARKPSEELGSLDGLGIDESTDGGSTTLYDSSAELESILDGDSASPYSLGESAIERYPPSLQQMAQDAEARLAAERRLRDRQTTEAQPSSSPIVQQEMEQFRRIKSAMLEAKTDHELWGVLDSQVLASMRLIQEAEDRLVQHDADSRAVETIDDSKRKPRARGKRKKTLSKDSAHVPDVAPPPQTVQANETEEDDIAEPAIQVANPEPTSSRLPLKPTTPTFHRLVRAYPALVLLAAQLLSRRTAYSPLAATVLPSIKSIGLTAWALAASTPLYNELLSVQWRVLHDLKEMTATLQEMEHVGVAGDGATLAILSEVAVYRRAALDGALGLTAQAVELLPSSASAFDAIQQHAQKIQQQIEAAALERVRRGEAEGMLRRQGVL